jgi:hypothetical protein
VSQSSLRKANFDQKKLPHPEQMRQFGFVKSIPSA